MKMRTSSCLPRRHARWLACMSKMMHDSAVISSPILLRVWIPACPECLGFASGRAEIGVERWQINQQPAVIAQ